MRKIVKFGARVEGSDKPPHVLLNHVDLDKQFDLVAGRRAVRESEGSFKVTDKDYQSPAILEGLSRI